MTLIAHGILKLNAVIKKRKYGYDFSSIDKLRKLKRAEDFIAEEMNLINRFAGGTLRSGKHPMAFESMLIANAAVLAASPIIGVVAGGKALVEKIKNKHAEAKQKAETQAKAKAKAEREKAEAEYQKAEAEAEKMEIDLALDLIEKADAVFARPSDEKKDASAKTLGLVEHPSQSKVVNLFAKDENKGDYVIFIVGKGLYTDGDTNIFFKNPETGNYEHVANITSIVGKTKIDNAIRKRTEAVFDKKIRNKIKTVKEAKR